MPIKLDAKKNRCFMEVVGEDTGLYTLMDDVEKRNWGIDSSRPVFRMSITVAEKFVKRV